MIFYFFSSTVVFYLRQRVVTKIFSILRKKNCMPQIIAPGTKLQVTHKNCKGVFPCLFVTHKTESNDIDSVWILNDRNESILVKRSDFVAVPLKKNSVIQFYKTSSSCAYRVMDFHHNSHSDVLVENLNSNTMLFVNLNSEYYHVLKP